MLFMTTLEISTFCHGYKVFEKHAETSRKTDFFLSFFSALFSQNSALKVTEENGQNCISGHFAQMREVTH